MAFDEVYERDDLGINSLAGRWLNKHSPKSFTTLFIYHLFLASIDNMQRYGVIKSPNVLPRSWHY